MMKKKKVQGIHATCLACFICGFIIIVSITPSWSNENAALDEEELFRIAMLEREKGNPYDSIEIFHSILSNQASLHRARLELAVAYYRTLQYDAAVEHANTVLSDPNIPQNVRLGILAFLAQVKKDRESFTGKHYWNFPLSAGFLFDSNVTAGPYSEIIPGSPLTLTPDSVEDSDWALVFAGGINHTYTTAKVIRTGEQPSNLIWQSGASIYHRGYDDRSEYDLNVYSLRTGPGLISRDRDWRSNFNFQWDDIYLGDDEHLANYYSFMPSVTWHKTNGSDLEITVDGIITYRDFHRDIDAGRDSTYLSGGISSGYVFAGNKYAVQGGVSLFDENADSDRRSNYGWDIFGGVAWNISKKTSLHGRANFRSTKYQGIEPPATDARDEEETRYIIGGRQALWEKGKTKLDLNVEITFADTSSNVYWYDYDRTQTLVTLDLTF